jgi:hypothetical protein
MTDTIDSSASTRAPELFGRTVIVIGGSAVTGATFDIDGGQQLVQD